MKHITWKIGRTFKKAAVKDRNLKIVVYGRPSSGKTTFLYALAASHEPNPFGFSCTWVSDTETIPEVDPGTDEKRQMFDEAVQFSEGRRWLSQAIRDVEGGDMPKANRVQLAPLRYLFDLTRINPARQQRIELIDYSGELVDPRFASEDRVQQLLKHLEEADGILVFAEAPRLDGTIAGNKDPFAELRVLQESLMLVAQRRKKRSVRPTPFGLVLNKWDRRYKSETIEYDPERVRREAEAFLNSQPTVPQRVLYDVLQAVAGELEMENTDNGNEPETLARVFSLSALGKTKQVLKTDAQGNCIELEIPVTLRPLQSFGLEDPLMWVWDMAEATDLAELRQGSRSFGAWKFWEAFSGQAPAIARTALQMAKRLPQRDIRVKELKAIADSARRCSFNQRACALFVSLITLFAGIESITSLSDAEGFRLHHPVLSQVNHMPIQAEPLEDFQTRAKAAEEFLVEYSKPTWIRWLSHWKNKPLAAVREQLASVQTVRNGVDLYLGKIKDCMIRAQNNSRDIAALGGILTEVESVTADETLFQPGTFKNGAIARLKQIRDDATIAIGEAELESAVNSSLGASDLIAATKLIKEKRPNFERKCEELEKVIVEKWIPLVTDKINQLIKGEQFPDARNYLLLIERDINLANMVKRPFLNSIHEIQKQFNEEQAKHYYRKWFYNKEDQTAAQDVGIYGTDSHKNAVKNWEKYSQVLLEPRDWQIRVSNFHVEATGAFSFANYRLAASISGDEVGSVAFQVSGAEKDADINLVSRRIKASYREALTVFFLCETTNFITGNLSFSTRMNTSPEQLRQSKVIILPGTVGYASPTIRVDIRSADGEPFPSAPELPLP